MKTTVALADHGRVIVEPLPEGKIQLTINLDGGCGDFATVELTQDQAGGLIWGLEQAAEAARIARERANGRDAQVRESYGYVTHGG